MSSHVTIYLGKTDDEGLFPFSVIKIPQYSNRPAYSKFNNFLLGNVENYEYQLACNKKIGALLASQKRLSIDTNRCIACLACLCSCRSPLKILCADVNDILGRIIPDFETIKERVCRNNLFNGELISMPVRDGLSLSLNSFDEYTAMNEVHHIALWTTMMLQFLASDEKTQVGKEIQIANPISPRDNRLDTCCRSYDKILVGETKTNLDSLLQENRYRTQIPSYQKVCEKLVQTHNRSCNQHKMITTLLIIGGRETDLLPPSHPSCSSVVGDQSLRFYNDIISHNIKFISANLIWLMGLCSLVMRRRLCWDLFLPYIFENPNVLGILSGGQVVKQRRQIIELNNISPKVLSSAVQDFS
jgi:hypothetical protein